VQGGSSPLNRDTADAAPGGLGGLGLVSSALQMADAAVGKGMPWVFSSRLDWRKCQGIESAQGLREFAGISKCICFAFITFVIKRKGRLVRIRCTASIFITLFKGI